MAERLLERIDHYTRPLSLHIHTMPRSSQYRPIHFLFLLPFVCGQISMQDVQPIVGFSSGCITAYDTQLSSCTQDMFRGVGGASQCSQECFNQLSGLTSTIQSACRGQQANGDTVIGHFFIGDADRWLCGFDTGAGATTDAAGTTSVSQTAAPESTSTAESTTEASTESSTSSKTKTTESSSTSTRRSSTTLETSTTSTDTSSSSTSSSKSAVATAASDNQQIGITGGGSPFDITLPAAGSSVRGSLRMSMMLGMAFAAVMVAQ